MLPLSPPQIVLLRHLSPQPSNRQSQIFNSHSPLKTLIPNLQFPNLPLFFNNYNPAPQLINNSNTSCDLNGVVLRACGVVDQLSQRALFTAGEGSGGTESGFINELSKKPPDNLKWIDAYLIPNPISFFTA